MQQISQIVTKKCLVVFCVSIRWFSIYGKKMFVSSYLLQKEKIDTVNILRGDDKYYSNFIFKWFVCLRHWLLRSNINWTKIKLLFISKGFQIPHFGKSVWIQYFLVTLQRFFWSLYITEIYRMNRLTQCKYGKIQTRKNRKM